MRMKNFKNNSRPVLILAVLFSILILLPSTVAAQRSGKGTRTHTKMSKQGSNVTGKLNIKASPTHGVGEVDLENYSGPPLQAVQFRILATSTNHLESVLPGSAVSDKKHWSFYHMIFPGTPDAIGKRTDTIRVVIFGNGSTVFPKAASIRLLVMNYQQPDISGTFADNTVTVKITNVVGALQDAEAASIDAGPEVSLNLWK